MIQMTTIQKLASTITLCSLFPILLLHAESPRAEFKDGQTLAAELRSVFPKKNFEVRGILKIRSRKLKITNDIPVIWQAVITGENTCDTIYETAQTPEKGSEKLIIRRTLNKPNEYLYARASSPKAPLPKPQAIPPDRANLAFAGSDFSFTDLGLDFLHWPKQFLVGEERRLNRDCYVLESINPKGIDIIRVKSWIDKETNAPLAAEAYDGSGEPVKEFSLSGSNFKKVNGEWQLEEIKIRSPKEGSQTTLKFDLPKN